AVSTIRVIGACYTRDSRGVQPDVASGRERGSGLTNPGQKGLLRRIFGDRPMHAYRTHSCGELRRADAGETVRLSGWVHRKRDHANLLFLDLRDHYGITQCVVDTSSPLFTAIEQLRPESVVTVTGDVVERTPDTVNPKLPTGGIEIRIAEFTLQAAAEL